MSATHSIFAGRVERRLGPPRPVPAPVVVCHPAPPPLPLAPDAELLAILEAVPLYGDTLEYAFRQKERALLELFATLSVDASRSLHARLVMARPDDEVATAFARMVPERRARLLAFLADARRREAIAAAKEVRRG